MQDIQFSLRKNGEGSFFIMDGDAEVATMEISVREKLLTVYHTEVAENVEGKGFGKALFTSMVDYARANHFKVRALCTYVHALFKRHPEEYADLWLPDDNTLQL